MSRQPYSKPALTLDQQIKQLADRGMVFDDPDLARHYLGHLNYYRLGAYWLPFELDHNTHQFQKNTHFDQILNLYLFDRELRLLVIDAIERIEVSIRTQLAYQLSHRYGPHLFLNSNLFKAARSRWNYQSNLTDLKSGFYANQEAFINHFKNKYVEPLPPIWAMVEILTFGQLSRWYANLKHRTDRNLIARQYDLDESNLTSFLHHLSIVRNLCAHHARLWNREFAFRFKLPRGRPVVLVNKFARESNKGKRIYNTLLMLAYFLDVISPGHHWKQHLNALIEKYGINVDAMGFPEKWQESILWK